MKVLIIGAGNPLPSFIERRLIALKANGVKILLVLENGQSCPKIDADIIRIGGKVSIIQKTLYLLRSILNIHLLIKMVSLRPQLPTLQRWKWAVKFFPLTRIKSPDIVHFQWLSFVSDFEWLRNFHTCPFVASARGSQVTIYPMTRTGYKGTIVNAIIKADSIHCVSMDISRHCEGLGANPQKLFVNYNGIDLNKFKPSPSHLDQRNFTLISIGSLIWRKGYIYQLLILRKLLAKGYKVQLTIVGDGPEKEGLFYTAYLMKITQNVKFSGSVEAHTIPVLLAKSAVYISTSAAEGLANSVVEAAACGLPVVTFDCEGMNELLEQGANGFILPFGDVEGMVEKIAFLIDNVAEREKMGTLSRMIAEKKFDEQVWVADMIKKYHELGKH